VHLSCDQLDVTICSKSKAASEKALATIKKKQAQESSA
jgi:hypothetical protein